MTWHPNREREQERVKEKNKNNMKDLIIDLFGISMRQVRGEWHTYRRKEERERERARKTEASETVLFFRGNESMAVIVD